MKIHRFIGKFNLSGDKINISDKDLIHQWKNVLKFKVGEIIILSNEDKGEALCQIISLSKSGAELKIAESYKNTNEPECEVTLYVSILKRENFELVIQKATEIGIKKIVPMICAHTVKTGLKMERLEKIAREASELSGRSTIPKISEPMKFEKAISDSFSSRSKFLFDISGAPLRPSATSPLKGEGISIFVGPEGGFTEEEINLAKSSNFSISSLGTLTFRAETAAIVASYLAVNI